MFNLYQFKGLSGDEKVEFIQKLIGEEIDAEKFKTLCEQLFNSKKIRIIGKRSQESLSDKEDEAVDEEEVEEGQKSE